MKILIPDSLTELLLRKGSFFDRYDIVLFAAATSDEVLKIHHEEKLDLLIIRLDMPGMRTEDLFSEIRNSQQLRSVSSILVCRDRLTDRERCSSCGANAIFTLPVDIDLFQIKAQQLSNIAPRKSYRAILAVAIQGKFRNKPSRSGPRTSAPAACSSGPENRLPREKVSFFRSFSPMELMSPGMERSPGCSRSPSSPRCITTASVSPISRPRSSKPSKKL